jgi:hypothetical protein
VPRFRHRNNDNDVDATNDLSAFAQDSRLESGHCSSRLQRYYRYWAVFLASLLSACASTRGLQLRKPSGGWLEQQHQLRARSALPESESVPSHVAIFCLSGADGRILDTDEHS